MVDVPEELRQNLSNLISDVRQRSWTGRLLSDAGNISNVPRHFQSSVNWFLPSHQIYRYFVNSYGELIGDIRGEDAEQLWFDIVELELHHWTRMEAEDQRRLEELLDNGEQAEYPTETCKIVEALKTKYFTDKEVVYDEQADDESLSEGHDS